MSTVLSIFKWYDVSEGGSASVIRREKGKYHTQTGP
jgi:hypothetical protein